MVCSGGSEAVSADRRGVEPVDALAAGSAMSACAAGTGAVPALVVSVVVAIANRGLFGVNVLLWAGFLSACPVGYMYDAKP